MPQGGMLTIGAEASDGSFAIHVSDTKVGIPADMRDKIFSPHKTCKAKGTGLELAVVKRIVEAHNGHDLLCKRGREKDGVYRDVASAG